MPTPVKLSGFSVNNYCRLCNINILISGRGKFNIFTGKVSIKYSMAARLSTILGRQLLNLPQVSSVICFKCRRDMEKFEKLKKAMDEFQKLSLDTYNKQVRLSTDENACTNTHVANQREKRCHQSSTGKKDSPLQKKRDVNDSPARPAYARQKLKLHKDEMPFQFDDDLFGSSKVEAQVEVHTNYIVDIFTYTITIVTLVA